ncbi:molybdopterin molybdotransferase MoeA [Novosphingobium sp. KACC 22771]|uniref:molybdopterin molybdotransferase MoeA n=1 Tax=Novosphingobium sp. KACC 22771 TaxID=3025670 RepID=UPI00236645FF|nr:molybdopterin molybdotransferase MoeA [Novosphingobium sp. KACC 22771]WDF71824.1 molybdopterin molybdotransferase MoeA [Novosphingobium sp. KACC 22771]
MSRAPLPLEEAQARVLALAGLTQAQETPIEAALGRYLAAPLLARRTQPAADLSAMDGYALAPGDLAGPWDIVGESAAGHPFAGMVRPGQAVRISTGALVPDGAGAVLCQEDAAREGERLLLTGTPPKPEGRHIRRRGLDFCEGDPLLPAGTRIGPAQMALAIAAGHGALSVHRRPRLAILDSGDELIAPGLPCPPDRLPASNGAMLGAMVAGLAGEVLRLGPVADDLDALGAALELAGDADVIVTSGGASVGDHDLIQPALARWGARVDFWKVAIRPGKPLLVATRGAQVVIGLPGNPVSSFVTAHLFLLPLLRAMQGAGDPLPRTAMARLNEGLGAGADRREFIRGWWDGREVMPRPMRDSSALAAMAASNCLIEHDAHAPARAAGEVVRIHLIENGGSA